MFSVENSVVKTLAHSNVRVLAMKLQLPYLPLDMVRRDSLMSAINIKLHATPVILLQAAPGYGKSTTLAQWLYQNKQQQENVAWLTLDPKENDLKRFITYLVCAINTASPSLALSSLQALDNGQSPQDIFHLLLNDISQSESVIHLALDGIHYLENAPVQDLLEQLVLYPPAQLRLYLTSCQQLPFPTARLESQGKLSVFSETDLKFNQDETQQWLTKHCSDNVANEVLESIHSLSQGWVNGIKLIQKINPDFNHFSLEGDESTLVDYFQQEWFNKLDEDELRICNQLAILGSANGDYLDEVFDQSDSAKILNQLIEKNIFVFFRITATR